MLWKSKGGDKEMVGLRGSGDYGGGVKRVWSVGIQGWGMRSVGKRSRSGGG